MENYNVNDILYRSSGYECTYIDFYKVIGKTETGKSLILQQIGQKVVDGDPMRVYYVVADETELIGKPIRVRIGKYGPQLLKEEYNKYLRKWDGKPQLANTGYSL